MKQVGNYLVFVLCFNESNLWTPNYSVIDGGMRVTCVDHNMASCVFVLL